MSTLRQLQGEVAFRMRRGDTFASVETLLIDPSGLSEAEKAALWLYGWSFVNRRRQRREAIAHIDILTRTPTTANVSDRRLPFAQLFRHRAAGGLPLTERYPLTPDPTLDDVAIQRERRNLSAYSDGLWAIGPRTVAVTCSLLIHLTKSAAAAVARGADHVVLCNGPR